MIEATRQENVLRNQAINTDFSQLRPNIQAESRKNPYICSKTSLHYLLDLKKHIQPPKKFGLAPYNYETSLH